MLVRGEGVAQATPWLGAPWPQLAAGEGGPVAGYGAERARGQRTREERSEMGRSRRRDCVSLPPMRGTEGKCWLEGKGKVQPR